MVYANVEQDLVPRWHELTVEESTKALTLLEDAAFWLDVWVPGLEAAVLAGGKAAMAAKLLSVAMVKRAMIAESTERPGVQSIQETGGIYNETITFRNPEGNLYLYEREHADLLTIVTGIPAGAASFTSPGL